MKYADTRHCTRGWGKVPMYHPGIISANEKTASPSLDQSEAEKSAHDHTDEFLTVTTQGDDSDSDMNIFIRNLKKLEKKTFFEINVAKLGLKNGAKFRTVVLSEGHSGGTLQGFGVTEITVI